MATTKYISPSLNKKVTFTQYVAELLVARKAKRENVSLPVRYWKNPNYIIWTKELQKQARGLSRLIKLYSENIILRSILENDWTYSAYSPKLIEYIREEQRKESLIIPIEHIPIIKSTNSIPNRFGKKSKRSKLDE
uniref:Uncharacterized protein n=1 Tax=viral metagenome TaxID=1070528 RepID=A0A6M3IK13_9ZZZZ